MQAAQMGLEFGEMKHCALVPYKDECKLMVQYQGWLALLWRSKAITDIQARVVYEGDLFKVSYGSRTEIVHEPAFESSIPVKYYALATPVGGQQMFEVMTVAHVEAHMKQYARGLDKKDSPWNTSFDAMALKTVLRKLIKLLPLSSDSEVIAALRADEQIWEADVKEARVEKFKQVSAAPDTSAAAMEKEAALRDYQALINEAASHNFPEKHIPTITEKDDAKRINATNDLIRSRLKGAASSQGESTYE